METAAKLEIHTDLMYEIVGEKIEKMTKRSYIMTLFCFVCKTASVAMEGASHTKMFPKPCWPVAMCTERLEDPDKMQRKEWGRGSE